MTEIDDARCLAVWLKGKPPEFACVLGARIALRMAPILGAALCADEASRRARIVLPCFRALAAASFAGAWPDRFGNIRQAARAAARHARDAMGEAFNDGQMNVVESIEAVPAEYGYIHEMKADADALGVASHVVDAIVHAVQAATEMVDANSGLASPDAVFESVIATGNAAHLAVDGANGYAEFHSDIEEDSEEEIETPPHISAFWKAVERDAIHLEASTDQEGKTGAPVEDLSKSALWLDGIPIWASRRWADFKDDLPSGEGWRVWTDWYEARLVGQPGNPAQEYERVTVSEEDLKQGPAQANAAIADLVTTSDRQLNDKESKLLGNREYQVALSFAGEQRDYVDAVAWHLAARSIAVFYDGFEQVGLWGRDGAAAFHEVFAEKATYVVMFISAEYAKKAWTRHERRSALSRMMKEEQEYVLPVRFDDTAMPGLPDSILYLRASDYSPAELSATIARKLGIAGFDGKASDVPPPRMTSPVGEVVFDYSSYNGLYVIGSGTAEFETKWSKASNRSIHVYNDPKSINGVALDRGATSIHEVTNAVALDYTSRSREPATGEVVVFRNRNGFYAAVHVLDVKDDRRGDGCDELRFRYAIQTDGTESFVGFRDILEQ